jgi:hypothetical protein
MAARSALTGLLLLGGVLVAAPTPAQDKSDADTASADESAEKSAESSDAAGDEEKVDKPESSAEVTADAAKDEQDKETSPVELKGETYRFVGIRYRAIIVPKFMIGLFADGGTTVVAHAGGAEFGIRKDNFEYNFGLWLAGYGMDPTPFKSTSDGEDAWELVESKIKVLYLTADFLWSHPFSPELALNYGMGAGLGVVWGPLYRNQAYRNASGDYVKCARQGDPNGGFYCGGDNNHYDNYEEPSWSDGGSKPIIFPWLALQTGLRYKPHRKFVGRLDVGFGLSGFFLGVGADYGI